MSLVSLSYAFFVLVVVALYYTVPKKRQWIVLLVASYVFYGLFSVKYLGLLILTTISTFYGSRYIYDSRSNKRRKWLLVLVLLINFSVLAFFKYYHIVFKGFGASQLILPLGISFYTFQSVSYLLDVYWKRCEAEKNLFKFALFVSFFPQIVQGPISRYKQLAPQLTAETRWNDDMVKEGIYKILGGLFKKAVIADRLSVLVDSVIGEHWKYSGSVLFFVILIYGVQIYCDFSGGIDIISGVANLFSIDLTPNFKRPLLATSIGDFWRRWHITLGSWMRDYVFYPISLSKWFGKVNKKFRNVFGPKLGKGMAVSVSSFIVYILVGIWHGSSFKYIAFGLWHGFFISLALLTEDFMYKVKKKLHLENKNRLWYICGLIYTTVVVGFGRYFSRAGSFMQALSMFKRTLFNFNFSDFNMHTFKNLGLGASDLWIAGISVLILLIYEIASERKNDLRKLFDRSPLAAQLTAIYLFLLFMIFAGFYAGNGAAPDFIYMQY